MYLRALLSPLTSRGRSNVRAQIRLLCALKEAASEQQSVFKEGSAALKAPSPDAERLETSEEVKELVDRIVKLSLIDICDLNKLLKEQADTVEPTKKTSFAVKLLNFDSAKKIALIKEIKGIVPGLNLVQAKKFVESLPQTVQEDLGETEAQKLKDQLAAVGGECSIE